MTGTAQRAMMNGMGLGCLQSGSYRPTMMESEGNAQDDEARFADLHRQLQAAQGRLAEAQASCSILADRVALAEGQGAVAAIGLLADLTQAERAIGPLEDDVLDAECALIMAGARGGDAEPDML